MIAKNDWRITNQEDYLKDKMMKKIKYKDVASDTSHDHCAFCWDKISAAKNDLHDAYCTLDEKHFVCEACFNDFKKSFNFKLLGE